MSLLGNGAAAEPAFVFDGVAVSAADFAKRVEETAAWLTAHEIGRGDVVAVWLVNRLEWVTLLFAAAKLGAIVAAVNTRYRSADVAHLLHLSGAKLLVVEAAFRSIDFAAILAGIGEAELPALAHSNIAGHFVAWNYLHACDGDENRAFIADWRRFSGDPNAVTNDPMEATWIGFHLWAAAVEAAGSTAIDKVRAALAGRRIAAPGGFTVWMDGATQHLHKPVMIGRIEDRGRIAPVSVTAGLVAPEPWSPWLPGASADAA